MVLVPLLQRALGALLFLAVVAPLGLSKSDPWELRNNYLASLQVEVFASGAATAAAAKSAAPNFHGFELLVFGAEAEVGGGSRDLPRIVLATPARLKGPDGARISAYFEHIGVEWTELGFDFYSRSWNMATDGLAATFEDPDRPGLPLTIWYANTEAALALYLKELEPCWTPGLGVFRIGETELEGALEVDGSLPTAELIDRRVIWNRRISSDLALPPVYGFDIRIPEGFDRERALEYLYACKEARDRSLLWADAEGTATASPGAAMGTLSMTVHSHVADLLELVGAVDLSLVNPVIGRVHVLLAPGLPDDGGAAISEVTARHLLGPPNESWMGPGASIYGANAWWGRELDSWVARLADGDVAPDLAILCAEDGEVPFISPHLASPLRGFWFGHLLDTRGEEFVRGLWDGSQQLTPKPGQTLEREYRAALAALATAQESQLTQARGQRRDAVESVPWRAGAALVPGPPGAGYGSRACGESLAELAASGANSFSLRAYAYEQVDGPQRPGKLHRNPIAASVFDLELASAAAAGSKLGMSNMLQPFLLSNPWGDVSASRTMTDPGRVQGFFVNLEPFTVHYALLAELMGSDILCVGTGLANTTQVPSDLESEVSREITAIKEQGWRTQLKLASDLFHGLVTYASATGEEARKLSFGDAGDFVSVEIFESLDAKALASQAPIRRELVQMMKLLISARLNFAQRDGQKLLIAGLGFASTEGSWRRPHLARGRTSVEAQELLFSALAEAIPDRRLKHGSAIIGIYLWNWSSFPSAGGLADNGYTPQNKPASKHLPEIFGAGE